jgi:hypothetical protein
MESGTLVVFISELNETILICMARSPGRAEACWEFDVEFSAIFAEVAWFHWHTEDIKRTV